MVLPLDRLTELEAERFVGSASPHAYAFMGHIVGRHIPTLINETAPTVAAKLREDGVNIAFLTPA